MSAVGKQVKLIQITASLLGRCCGIKKWIHIRLLSLWLLLLSRKGRIRGGNLSGGSVLLLSRSREEIKLIKRTDSSSGRCLIGGRIEGRSLGVEGTKSCG